MATLNGQQINNTYSALIKTADNAALSAVEKEITDGVGTSSTLKLGTTSASFVGTLDVTGATVTGLPDSGVQSVVAGTNVTVDNTDPANPIVSATGGDAAGLVAGTGPDSMQSASFLTPNPANASGSSTIVLGNNSSSVGPSGIAIGNMASTGPEGDQIAIGSSAYANRQESIALGTRADATGVVSCAIGRDSEASGQFSQAFGFLAVANVDGAIALGDQVTASIGNTVSIKALETQTDSTPTAGGIIMSDAGGTNRRLNINATGGLQVDSTPVTVEAKIITPVRKFNTTGDNTWNFAHPTNSNNYANVGFSTLTDASINRRFFVELWADSISEVAVLVNSGQFDGALQAEIFDVHPETGMPRNVIAASSTSTTTGTGTFNWHTMNFGSSILVAYAQYYLTIKVVSGSTFGGIYGTLNLGAGIQRFVEIPNLAASPSNPNSAINFVTGMYDGSNITGNYALNYAFSYRVDSYPNLLFKP